ncbi:DUF5995 family protein [Maribellus mangrovi]|uniref:DUF5995 family protein n=1 Tax=Maribellus mangrovi TaxID=3133146 RepID=UPI0030EC4721
MKPLTHIDDVISVLDEIILESSAKNSTMGYFAVLYQKVTIKVKEKITAGFFDDGPRMEKLDVLFAKRYIDAYYDYKNQKPATQSWEIAFNEAGNSNLLVVQHLLLGMNAHINLDLGIAAAEISGADNIKDLEADFIRINEILASMVDEVQHGISSIWPFLRKILRLLNKVDNYIIDWSMKIARKGAWKYAQKMAIANSTNWLEEIAARDQKVAAKTKIIIQPGKWILFLFWIIRVSERGSIADKIAKLKQ